MPLFLKKFFFDHDGQIPDMLTLGAMFAIIALTFLTINFASTLTTDTNSNHYETNYGLKTALINQPGAHQNY